MEQLVNKINNATNELKTEIIELVQGAVQIPSLSGESEGVQKYLKNYLDEMGLETDLIKVNPDSLRKYYSFTDDKFSFDKRYSLVGIKRGSDNYGKSLILNGHIDVVPTGNIDEWSDSPWSGVYKDGKIFGRGSLDMKAGLCSGIAAIKVLQKIGFENFGDVYINSVCGEETGGCGALATIDSGISADACIILEPTKLNICHIQSGSITFRIKILGKSIHACMKNKGVNAIDKFIKIYESLKKLDKDRHEEYSSEYFEYKYNVAPLNLGILKSGEWPSSVPDTLIAEGRLGVFPNESVADAKKVFEDTIKKACLEDDWLRNNMPEIEWFEGLFESTETDINDAIIKTLTKSHEEILGRKVNYEGVTYGSDMRIFNIYGNIPSILYGPGDVSIAHTCNENIIVGEVLETVKSIALTITKWCGGKIK